MAAVPAPVFDDQRNIKYKVTIVEGKNLPAVDNHGTSSDPYVVIKFGFLSVAQTHYIKKNLNPTWDQTFRFQSPVPVLEAKFTVRDHNTVKHDVTLGEALFVLDTMGQATVWEGDLHLSGHQTKADSQASIKIRIERKNFVTRWGKVSKSFNKLEDRAKKLMMDKTSNLARLAFLTAYNHMATRKLQGSIEVQVQLGWFMVCLSTEMDAKEKEATGSIEIVEDSEHNNGPTQTKPTKGMKKNIDGRIKDVLDNIETTSTKLSSNVAVTVKAGLVIGFLLSPIPKLEIQVQVLLGVQVKAGVGNSALIAKASSSKDNLAASLNGGAQDSPQENTTEDEELKDLICKLAIGDAAT